MLDRVVWPERENRTLALYLKPVSEVMYCEEFGSQPGPSGPGQPPAGRPSGQAGPQVHARWLLLRNKENLSDPQAVHLNEVLQANRRC